MGDFMVDLPDANVLFRTPPSPIKDKDNLAAIEDQLKQLKLDLTDEKTQEKVDEIVEEKVDFSVGLSEASGWTETASPEPKTLQEFLLLPENVEAMNAGNLFTVVPLTWCPHVELVQSDPGLEWSTKTPCSVCKDPSENWICLTCYQVDCGRYVAGHMRHHSEESGHMMALSFSDLSVWCYGCDAYIDHQVRSKAKHVFFKHTVIIDICRLFTRLKTAFTWRNSASLCPSPRIES